MFEIWERQHKNDSLMYIYIHQRDIERDTHRERQRESTCLIVARFEKNDLSLLYLEPSNLLMSKLKHYLHGSVHKKFLDY